MADAPAGSSRSNCACSARRGLDDACLFATTMKRHLLLKTATRASLLSLFHVVVFGFSAPNPPFTFRTTFLASYPSGYAGIQVSELYNGVQGERGTEPIAYHTQRLDSAYQMGSASASSGTVNTVVTSIDVTYKTNGTSRSVTFWTSALLGQADSSRALSLRSEVPEPSLGSTAGFGAGQLACADTAALPSPWEALNWDWLELGSAGPLNNLGNETISTALAGQVVASHWQSVSACRDIWLVDVANPDNPQSPYTVPVRYSLADPSSSPACDALNRSYDFANTTLLTPDESGQGSAYFTIPDACNASAAAANGGAAGNPGGNGGSGVGAVWVGVGCILCAIVGGLVGVMLGRRQVFSQLQATSTRLQTQYGQTLMDAY